MTTNFSHFWLGDRPHNDGTESCEKVAEAEDCEIIELRLGLREGEIETKATLKRIIDLKHVVCDYV